MNRRKKTATKPRRRSRKPVSLAQRLSHIAKQAAPRFKEPYRSIDHAELLYDEMGLPK